MISLISLAEIMRTKVEAWWQSPPASAGIYHLNNGQNLVTTVVDNPSPFRCECENRGHN